MMFGKTSEDTYHGLAKRTEISSIRALHRLLGFSIRILTKEFMRAS